MSFIKASLFLLWLHLFVLRKLNVGVLCCVAAAPVANISVVGSSWLQHGDIWDLQVYWNGSAGFEYCIKILSGSYNVSGRVSYSCL